MCDTTVVVGPGRVLFAKNSDRDLGEAQLLEWHPRRTYAADERVACTWLSIPQARETHAVLISRPFWMWGAEMGANERGVVIGNEAVFTRGSRTGATGLTGMDLLRLALERADSAEAACAVIVELLARHGQGGGCGYEDPGFRYSSSFLIADAGAAFVLETAGAAWASERVDGARSISNGLTIDGFAQRHGDPLRTAVAGARTRRGWTERHARDAAGPAALMRALREHGTPDGLPRHAWHHGGLHAPCVHAGGLLAGAQTAASWVSELRPGRARHWATATAAPCTSLFKPVAVDTPVAYGPVPGARCSGALWWRHERLHRAVLRDPAAVLPALAAGRDAIEARWLADLTEPPDSAGAFAEHERWLDEWLARALAGPDRRPWFARRYTARRDRSSGLGGS